jgi:hypothetical protein
LVHLRFDFDPLTLRDPNTEAVATYLELSKDPTAPANTAQVLGRLSNGGRSGG